MKAKFIYAVFLSLLFTSHVSATDQSKSDRSSRPHSNERLKSVVMSQNIPLEKRIKALKELYHDRTENGRIHRTFCIWDPLGKMGPIAATVEDQAVRSIHYGLGLTVTVFNNEKELVENFKTQKTCDAILFAVQLPWNSTDSQEPSKQ